jgi:hypothetical protein
MAFDQGQRYLVRFDLPDGEHLITGVSSQDINVAREHYKRIVEQNPEAKFYPEKVEPATPEQVEAAIQALREKDQSRPLATDLGLDSPNRILSNPEVVPGSKHVPAAPAE